MLDQLRQMSEDGDAMLRCYAGRLWRCEVFDPQTCSTVTETESDNPVTAVASAYLEWSQFQRMQGRAA